MLNKNVSVQHRIHKGKVQRLFWEAQTQPRSSAPETVQKPPSARNENFKRDSTERERGPAAIRGVRDNETLSILAPCLSNPN